MARDYADIQASGADVLIIGGGTRQDAATYHARHKLPFAVLADEDGSVYERYRVGRWFLSLLRQSGLMVVGPTGQIAYAVAVNDPRRALDRDAVLATLRSLAAGGGTMPETDAP